MQDGSSDIHAVEQLLTAFTAASKCWDSVSIDQLDWTRVSDEGCLLICTELSKQGAGIAEWKGILSAVLLPKFLALSSSASQSFVSAFVETGARNAVLKVERSLPATCWSQHRTAFENMSAY